MTSSAPALLLAALLVAPLAAGAEPKASQREWRSPADEGCALFDPEAAGLDARTCAGCHQQAGHGHPVEVDYAQARYRPGNAQDLRTLPEVQRRGVRLVDGKVSCVTCHDGASRFASHLAIPAHALVRPAIDPGNPDSYESEAPLRPASLVRQGAQVSPKPLCLSCHAKD